jgi:hypothetical protein
MHCSLSTPKSIPIAGLCPMWVPKVLIPIRLHRRLIRVSGTSIRIRFGFGIREVVGGVCWMGDDGKLLCFLSFCLYMRAWPYTAGLLCAGDRTLPAHQRPPMCGGSYTPPHIRGLLCAEDRTLPAHQRPSMRGGSYTPPHIRGLLCVGMSAYILIGKW